MSRQGITIVADVSLLAFEKRIIDIDGGLAVDAEAAMGVLEFKVDSGEFATAIYAGRTEAIAGAAVAAGGRVDVASGGFLIPVTSGSTSVGFAEDKAVSSGSAGNFVLDLTNVYKFA